MATTVPGGLYLNGGRLVNANGEPVDAPIEQPAEVAPVEAQPEPVADETSEIVADEQPAEVAPVKGKRSKK